MTLKKVADQGIEESMAFLSERTEKKYCLKTHIAYDATWSIFPGLGTGVAQIIVLTSLQCDMGYIHDILYYTEFGC